MKRKTLIVLLVLLLVGILAFTVFACNDNKKPNNPGTTPGGDGPGPDDDDPPEDERIGRCGGLGSFFESQR